MNEWVKIQKEAIMPCFKVPTLQAEETHKNTLSRQVVILPRFKLGMPPTSET
jgi:hypothetical protein